MSRFHRCFSALTILAACVVSTGCSSTATVRGVAVAAAPPAAARKLVVTVDKTKNNERGEATALENGLVREFRAAGYEIGDGGLAVRATVLDVHHGSTIANVTTGMGTGSDRVDVAVRVADASGKELMTFTVQGKANDKRYRRLDQVLYEDVPGAIREEIEHASR